LLNLDYGQKINNNPLWDNYPGIDIAEFFRSILFSKWLC